MERPSRRWRATGTPRNPGGISGGRCGGPRRFYEDKESSLQTRFTGYVRKVTGPWVFGVYMNKNEFRFFVVLDRKSSKFCEMMRIFCATDIDIPEDE